MAEFIEILSPSALKDLTTANNEVVKLISNINSAGQAIQSIKTPSGSDSAVKNLNEKLIRQEKLYTDLQIKLQRYAQAQQQTAIKNNQLEASTIRLNKAKETSVRQLEREQAKLAQANNLYNQTQLKVNQLTQTYNALAIKKELGLQLTTKETTQLSKLTTELNIYQSALKKVDADIQKNQRNVGNYASGWNGLGNSINQLSREAPAFANSVQTGFMAISNNLPILFDEISKVRQANADLIAQGKPIQSTFSQIAGAILSWQTLLSVGVTVLTLYGAKIWDSISGAKEKKKALEEEKKAIEAKVEAERKSNESIGQSIAQEQNRARILFEIAKNQEVSDAKRNEALKELRDRYGKYLKDLSDEQILAGQTAEAEERLNKALIGRGYALATQSLLEENLTKQMSAQVEFQKTLSKGYKNITKANDDLRNSTGKSTKTNDDYWKSLKETTKANTTAEKTLNAKLKPLKEEEQVLLSLFKENAKYLDSVVENTKATKDNKKAKEEKEKIDQDSLQALEETISALQKEQKQVSFGSETYEALGFQLKLLQTIYDGLTKKAEETTEAIKGIELDDEQLYEEYFAWLKLKEATDEYIRTVTSDAFNNAFNNIGLASAKMFLDFDENGKSTFDKLIEGADTMSERFAVSFQAIGDVAQDVIGMMQNLENQRSEQQLANLEREYQTALLFAGESTTAREELERQYDERRKAIQRKQAQQQKQLAIFNILINTAQGVVSALAMTPPNVPLSIAIGAIGALQAGIVASQQLPQFYKGTDNAPEGWAWTQEKGAEIITDKSGKIKTLGSDKGAQKTYLNKGDKVYTASQTESILFNNELNGILTNNGISNAPTVIVDGGLSKEDFNNGISKLAKTISEKESFSISRDKRGERVFREKQNKRTELLNVRLKMGKYDV
jgi:hypothetical protein